MSVFSWLITTAHAAQYVELPPLDFYGSSTATNPPSPEGIANNILGLLISLAYPLAIAAFFYSAYILLNSGGKPEAVGTVKKNILYVVAGFALIIFAVVILRFVLGLFAI